MNLDNIKKQANVLLENQRRIRELQEINRDVEFQVKKEIIDEGAWDFLSINWGTLRRVMYRGDRNERERFEKRCKS
jgi:hypothetical protein